MTAVSYTHLKKRAGAEAYLHGWGPNEYTPTGTLRDYEDVYKRQASVRCFRHWRRSPLQHPVLSALLAWHLPHLARRIGT